GGQGLVGELDLGQQPAVRHALGVDDEEGGRGAVLPQGFAEVVAGSHDTTRKEGAFPRLLRMDDKSPRVNNSSKDRRPGARGLLPTLPVVPDVWSGTPGREDGIFLPPGRTRAS